MILLYHDEKGEDDDGDEDDEDDVITVIWWNTLSGETHYLVIKVSSDKSYMVIKSIQWKKVSSDKVKC